MVAGFLIGLHCMGAIACFLILKCMEELGEGLEKVFGFYGKKTPTWQIFLLSCVWEIYLIASYISVKREK